MVAPLKNNLARSVMEAACNRTADSLRFRPPHIPHAVAVMVMEPTFHTKDPEKVGNAMNIFCLPTSPPWQGRRRRSSLGSWTRSWG